MRKMLIVLAALTALTGAACSSSGGDDAGSDAGADAGASPAAGCTADNAVDLTGDNPFIVTIQDLAFQPDCFAAQSASTITVRTKTP